MYSPKPLIEGICKGLLRKYYSNKAESIVIRKALVISKLSRYQYERKKYEKLTDKEFEKLLHNRGTDLAKLLHFHYLHKEFEENVSNTLMQMGIDVEVVNRFNCTGDRIDQADIIVPTGGDGTFLLAASMVMDNKKPVVGFNSDPNRSEGYLCLPKKYSTNVRGAIERLQEGKFKWLMRSRIRTTLVVSDDENLVPHFLHGFENDSTSIFKSKLIKKNGRFNILPILSLNEVFVGEKLSARVSHLQMRLDGSIENTNLKCSGICLSTGTGSTSWHTSMNRLPVQSVAELLRIMEIKSPEGNDTFANLLSETYNKSLIFPPDDQKMGYTIRDLISAGVWPQPKGIKSRGFASKIEIKSNCFDACLVVDGGVAFSFNDGTVALLEILPEDALKTVIFKD